MADSDAAVQILIIALIYTGKALLKGSRAFPLFILRRLLLSQ
jgi:hypothetical protein